MALVYILLITAVTLAVLRLALPRRLQYLLGPAEFGAALLLPTLATVAPLYMVFALGAALIVAGLPAMVGGKGPTATMEHRLRLFFFCLPIMPLLSFTAMLSSFTISQINYITIIAAGVAASMVMGGGVRVPAGRLAGWDMTFVAMMLAQLFMEARDSDVMFTIRTVLQVTLNLGLPYFVVSRGLATAREPLVPLVSLLLGIAVVSAMALFESVRFWLLYEAMVSAVGADAETLSGYTKLRGGMLRARATFPESTGLSLFLACALTMVFALRRQFGGPLLVLVLTLLIGSALAVTFARVGYIALGVGIVVCLLNERRYGLLAAALVGLPLAAWALISLGDSVPFIAALVGTSDDSIGSVDYRSMLFDSGLEVIAEHPLVGMSLADLLVRLDHLKQGEGIVDFVNQPLTILMRAGILGGLVYFLMTFRVMIAAFARRPADPVVRAGIAAVVGSLAGLLAGLFTTSFGRNETTFILLLASGAGLMARRAAVRAAQPNAASASRTAASPAPRPPIAVASISSS